MQVHEPTESTTGRIDRLKDALQAAHGVPTDAMRTVVSPYRVCPIGAHSDHQGGTTLGMAVSAYNYLTFAPNDSRHVVLTSDNFPGEVSFDLGRPGARAESGDNWGDYPRGAAWALRRRLPSTPTGLLGHVSGSLPGGGLSSSASVTLAYLLAFADVNGVTLDQREQVDLALTAERDFVGVSVGILDPATIAGSTKGCLLLINCRDARWEPLALGDGAPEYRMLAAFAGVTRRLQSTPFNERVAECFRAARKLGELAGRRDVSGLSDIPERVFQEHEHDLRPGEARRARHFFTERSRVTQGMTFWQEGDLQGFGRLMNESCQSSIANWESGSDELIALQRILEETPGIFGSRFSGAGFGGCCVALVDAAHAEKASASVRDAMSSQLPSLDAEPRVFLLDSVDGVRLR